MPATRKSESGITYFQVKHFCLWQEIKRHIEGCQTIEVTNPKTKEVLTKHGYAYDEVAGHVTKIEKYDRKHNGTRFFGFKVTVYDGTDTFVVDMPYSSQILRRFLKVVPNVDWTKPLSIKVFKGKGRDDREETAIWFRQNGATVKAFYTKETPHAMPAPKHYQDDTWDFREQHEWLVAKFQSETVPAILAAAKAFGPPIPPAPMQQQTEPDMDEPPQNEWGGEVSDDDVPFSRRSQRGERAGNHEKVLQVRKTQADDGVLQTQGDGGRISRKVQVLRERGRPYQSHRAA